MSFFFIGSLYNRLDMIDFFKKNTLRLQIPGTSIKHFTSIARRLYRIFAHAWFHHREIFEQCEVSPFFQLLLLEHDMSSELQTDR